MKCIQIIMDYIIIVKVRVFNVCIRIFHVALEYLSSSYYLMHATPHLSPPYVPCPLFLRDADGTYCSGVVRWPEEIVPICTYYWLD